MGYGTICEDVSFPSSSGVATIRGRIWWPADEADAPVAEPRGIVQLVHGMAEHIGRYAEFARFLCAAGFVVGGHDHLGHGKSAPAHRHGCIPLEGSSDAMVEDIHRMRSILTGRAGASLPYFLFGHSMGSFAVRCYIASHGAGLAGAILCGTGYVQPALSRLGGALSRTLAATRGEDYRSKLVDGLGIGAYARQVEGADNSSVAWISHSKENIEHYKRDEDCGFMFSVGGYAALTGLTLEACKASCAKRVPKGLPLLFVSGADDPVGGMGTGVAKSAELYRRAGVRSVRCTLYPNMRHEILNEAAGQQVFNDVLAWMKEWG